MPQNQTWISGNAGVSVFEEDEEFKEHATHDHVLYISAQGKGVEFGIDEELFKQISEEFEDLDP